MIGDQAMLMLLATATTNVGSARNLCVEDIQFTLAADLRCVSVQEMWSSDVCDSSAVVNAVDPTTEFVSLVTVNRQPVELSH